MEIKIIYLVIYSEVVLFFQAAFLKKSLYSCEQFSVELLFAEEMIPMKTVDEEVLFLITEDGSFLFSYTLRNTRQHFKSIKMGYKVTVLFQM